MKKEKSEEEIFRERLADCPYLYAVQQHWSRVRTKLTMRTLELKDLLRLCSPEDLNRFEVFVYHEVAEVRHDHRGLRWQGEAISTHIESIWYFIGGHHLAFEIGKVSWEGAVLDLIIATRSKSLQGPQLRRKVPWYEIVEVLRGRSVQRVAELLVTAKHMPPISVPSN